MVLIGCALYVDALKAPSLLGLQNILQANRSLKAQTNLDPLKWPTVQLVRNRLTTCSSNKYQGVALLHFNDAMLRSCLDQSLADVSRLERKMRERLEWSDVKLLRAILAFLDTLGALSSRVLVTWIPKVLLVINLCLKWHLQ